VICCLTSPVGTSAHAVAVLAYLLYVFDTPTSRPQLHSIHTSHPMPCSSASLPCRPVSADA